MKVILKVDVDALGKAGDIVDVKDGYARNYLIPKKKAIEATPENLKRIEEESRIGQEKASRARRQAEKIARKIESLSLTVVRQAGEKDKLFGSVTSIDIEKSLKEEGIEIDRKKILLKEPIKSLGIYSVPIKVHQDITANLKVWVVKE
jgi:large subunit ribosomal protein L9